jgi:hypothetical protein
MSSEQNKAIRRQEYEAVNQKKLDALDEVIASDVTSHPARPGQAPGLEGVKQLFSSLHAAFPDFQHDRRGRQGSSSCDSERHPPRGVHGHCSYRQPCRVFGDRHRAHR